MESQWRCGGCQTDGSSPTPSPVAAEVYSPPSELVMSFSAKMCGCVVLNADEKAVLFFWSEKRSLCLQSVLRPVETEFTAVMFLRPCQAERRFPSAKACSSLLLYFNFTLIMARLTFWSYCADNTIIILYYSLHI